MRFDLITIFPEFFAGPLDYGIVRRAREARLIETHVHDLRAFTHDRHRTVDDRPFGGGEGMVMKPEPLFDAVESLFDVSTMEKTAIVLLSAAGKRFRQETARRFAQLERVVLICGRYEGVDERVAEHLATDEISIGDFVLSGGELAGAMILDAVTRLIPGALGNEDSAVNESFSADGASEAPLRGAAGTSHVIVRPTNPARRRRPAKMADGGFWIIRITRGRRRFAGGTCRRFWSAGITRRSGAGGARRRWKRRDGIGPICCDSRRVTLRNEKVDFSRRKRGSGDSWRLPSATRRVRLDAHRWR